MEEEQNNNEGSTCPEIELGLQQNSYKPTKSEKRDCEKKQV